MSSKSKLLLAAAGVLVSEPSLPPRDRINYQSCGTAKRLLTVSAPN
jgi:hypothetical protein